MLHTLSQFGVRFDKSELDNGVNVFGFYRAGMPVCVRVNFFAGARYDTLPGIAHFLEHMLVAGTEKYPSKDQLAQPLERVGGGFSAFTDMDSIDLNISVPQKEDLEIGLEILEQMIWHSLFDDKTIETERGAITAEIGESEEDPHYVLGRLYSKIAFNKTPLEKNVAGSKDSVKDIQKQDILEFKNKFCRAGRMTILISGGIAPEEYMPLIEKYLGRFKPEPRLALPETAKISREDFLAWKPFRENKQAYARMGFRTMGFNENDREMAALDVAADILGGGRTARLTKELRYKHGLVYSVGAGHYNWIDAGNFIMSTSFECDKLDRVINAMINEVKKLAEDGITPEELDFTKSAITKTFFNTTQTSWSWINIHEDQMTLNPGRAKTLDSYMNEVDSLTLEDVNAAVKKYLNKDNFYLALCGVTHSPSVTW